MEIESEKLLLFGRQYTKSNSKIVGGVITSFEILKDTLDELNVSYEVVDTNYRNYRNRLYALIHVLWVTIKGFNGSKYISLHGTATDFFYLAPILVFFAKVVYKKKISLRKFAGGFDEAYENANYVSKLLARYSLMNADAVFFQTKYLIKRFKEYNNNTYWMPTTRKRVNNTTPDNYDYKFVFVGQVKYKKGIGEIIDVFSSLNDKYSVDIYGPLDEDINKEIFCHKNITYKGLLATNEVQPTLALYNVMLMPTHFKREGYPGVIIEAFSVGMPVIATNVRGIKELVPENAGILIDPENVEQLKNAVIGLSQLTYKSYRKFSLEYFEEFDVISVTKKYLERL